MLINTVHNQKLYRAPQPNQLWCQGICHYILGVSYLLQNILLLNREYNWAFHSTGTMEMLNLEDSALLTYHYILLLIGLIYKYKSSDHVASFLLFFKKKQFCCEDFVHNGFTSVSWPLGKCINISEMVTPLALCGLHATVWCVLGLKVRPTNHFSVAHTYGPLV